MAPDPVIPQDDPELPSTLLENAVRAGLLTREELEETLTHLARPAGVGGNRPVGEVLVEKGHLSPEAFRTLENIRAEFEARPGTPSLGRALLRKGLLSRADLQEEGEVRRLGRYELRTPLGRGAMGEVFLAWDSQIGREVAIKILHPALRGESFVPRFLREMKILGAIDHPNVIQILDAGSHQGRHFYVMPVAGDRTFSPRALPLADAVKTLEQVARACHACHEKGIVHRDLKPTNILLGDRPRVSDFGLAKVLDAADRLTRSGILLGTPVYMSPEQAVGEEVDARADVFSLGVMLYEVLAHCLPFAGDNVFEILARIANQPPIPPRSVRPEVPRALEAVALRAIDKRRERRHPTAEAFADDLARWRESRPSLLDTRLFSLLPRRVAVLAATAIASLLAGVGLAAVLGIGIFRPAERGSREEPLADSPSPASGGERTERIPDPGTGAAVVDPDTAPPQPDPGAVEQQPDVGAEAARIRSDWIVRLAAVLSDPSSPELPEIERKLRADLRSVTTLAGGGSAEARLAEALLESIEHPDRGDEGLAELAGAPDGPADAILFLAEHRLAGGDLAGAGKAAVEAAVSLPQDRRGHVVLALVRTAEAERAPGAPEAFESLARACESFARALEDRPGSEATSRFLPLLWRTSLSLSLRFSFARDRESPEAFARLLARTRRAAALRPDSPAVLVAHGGAAVVLGVRRTDSLESAGAAFAEAREALLRANTLDPSNFLASFWLAAARDREALYRSWVLGEDPAQDLALRDEALEEARALRADHPLLDWWKAEGSIPGERARRLR